MATSKYARLDSLTPRQLVEEVKKLDQTVMALSACVYGMIEMSHHKQILVPRNLIRDKFDPAKHSIMVSMAGTRFCYKINDITPGQKSVLWTPPGFKGGMVSGD